MTDEIRLKRLAYRSGHRGCKETDVILGHFAQSHMTALSPALLDIYERLLDEDDAEIWDWLTGKSAPIADYAPLIDLLKGYGLPQ